MKSLLVAALLGLAAPVFAETALAPLDPANPPEAWKPILTGIGRTRLIESGFTERRYMKLRKKPFETPGVMRYSPDIGVSITRRGDTEEVVLVKADGLYKRDDAGAFKKIPYDVAATRAPRLLLAVVGFDGAKVAKDFAVVGETHDGYWTMELTPRSADIASVVSRMRVTGFRDKLMTITLYDEDRIRLEIIIDSVAFPEAFSADTLKSGFGVTK